MNKGIGRLGKTAKGHLQKGVRMVITRQELKRDRWSLLIWSVSVGGIIAFCLFLFPQMKKEIGAITEAFSGMESISNAFGMNQLNLGTVMGFYGLYGGCILGIGGMFFAAVLGTGMLSREEREHTAEFLFTHPVSRGRIFAEKLAAVLGEILAFNLIVAVCSIFASMAIKETLVWEEFFLFHGAQILMQMEIGGICFGISAFIRRGSISIGMGIAAFLYFLGLLQNITEKMEVLRYVTPFSYADAADILETGKLDGAAITVGMIYMAFALVIGFAKLRRKDL